MWDVEQNLNVILSGKWGCYPKTSGTSPFKIAMQASENADVAPLEPPMVIIHHCHDFSIIFYPCLGTELKMKSSIHVLSIFYHFLSSLLRSNLKIASCWLRGETKKTRSRVRGASEAAETLEPEAAQKTQENLAGG